MADPPLPQPPFDVHAFFAICLHYEYLKDKENPRQARNNLTEMMISLEFTLNVTRKGILPMDRRKTSSDGTSIGSSEAFDSEGPIDSPEDGDRASEDVGNGFPKIKETEATVDSPKDVGNAPEDTPMDIDKLLESNKQKRAHESSPTDSDTSLEPRTKRKKSFTELSISTIDSSRSDSLNRSSQTFEMLVDCLTLDEVVEYFDRMEKGEGEKKELVVTEEKLGILREIGLTVIWPLYEKTKFDKLNTKLPYNHITTITNDNKFKVHLKNTETGKRMNIEYWDCYGDTLVWTNNSIRFIRKRIAEKIACSELMGVFMCSIHWHVVFEEFKVEYEEKSKWKLYTEVPFGVFAFSFYQQSMVFNSRSYNIVKKFSLMVDLAKEGRYYPFDLRFLSKYYLKTIELRAWKQPDLGQPIQGIDKNYPFKYDLYNYKNNRGQWVNAKCLDIRDPDLRWFLPNPIGFRKVLVWELGSWHFQRIYEKYRECLAPAKCVIEAEKEIDRLEIEIFFRGRLQNNKYSFRSLTIDTQLIVMEVEAKKVSMTIVSVARETVEEAREWDKKNEEISQHIDNHY